jgi:hypothetical protein
MSFERQQSSNSLSPVLQRIFHHIALLMQARRRRVNSFPESYRTMLSQTKIVGLLVVTLDYVTVGVTLMLLVAIATFLDLSVKRKGFVIFIF